MLKENQFIDLVNACIHHRKQGYQDGWTRIGSVNISECGDSPVDGFMTAFTDGEVCSGCVTDGHEPHADWCLAHLEPGLELEPPPPHKCPFCDTPMSLGDGCYWCDNPNCELKL